MGSAAVCEAGSNYASRVGFDLTRICLPLLGLKVCATTIWRLWFLNVYPCSTSLYRGQSIQRAKLSITYPHIPPPFLSSEEAGLWRALISVERQIKVIQLCQISSLWASPTLRKHPKHHTTYERRHTHTCAANGSGSGIPEALFTLKKKGTGTTNS